MIRMKYHLSLARPYYGMALSDQLVSIIMSLVFIRPSLDGTYYGIMIWQADVQLDEVTPVAGGLTLHSCYCN